MSSLEQNIRGVLTTYEEATEHDCSSELLDTAVVRLLKLHAPKFCKDCKWRVFHDFGKEWYCDNEFVGELCTDSDHSLGYDYAEGGGFIPSEKFGCVNFEAKD